MKQEEILSRRVIVVDQYGVPITFGGGVTGAVTDAQLRALPLAINAMDPSGIDTSQIVRSFDLMITRPADTDPYLAGDVIAGTAIAKFLNVAKAAGYGVIITNVRAQTDDTGLAGKAININFYSDTVTHQANNAVYSVSDPAKRAGQATITFGTGARASVGADTFTNIMLNPFARDISVIVDTEAFTPSAVSTNIRIFIQCILTN